MERRKTFNTIATRYDANRPLLPDESIQWIAEHAGVDRGSRILEVGAGTGQATIPLLEYGFDVDCVEPGDELAKILRTNVAAYGDRATVSVCEFERWVPTRPDLYPLIVVANAFHWLDPESRYRRCADLLCSDGYLALVWHEYPYDPDDRVATAYELLAEVSPDWSKRGGLAQPDRQGERLREISASGYFVEPHLHCFEWTAEETPEMAMESFCTQSTYLALDDETKRELDRRLRITFSKSAESVQTRHVTSTYLGLKLSD